MLSRFAKVGVGGVAAFVIGMVIPAAAMAATPHLTASIGCDGDLVAFNATGTSLPANKSFDIIFHRSATGNSVGANIQSSSRRSSSNGILVTPTYYNNNLSDFDGFGTEYVTAKFYSGSTSYGTSPRVSVPDCGGGGSFHARHPVLVARQG